MRPETPFQRGDKVYVLTDRQPRPKYIVLACDFDGARLCQKDTGFFRSVPVRELEIVPIADECRPR